MPFIIAQAATFDETIVFAHSNQKWMASIIVRSFIIRASPVTRSSGRGFRSLIGLAPRPRDRVSTQRTFGSEHNFAMIRGAPASEPESDFYPGKIGTLIIRGIFCQS
jgi:hypothetical protein